MTHHKRRFNDTTASGECPVSGCILSAPVLEQVKNPHKRVGAWLAHLRERHARLIQQGELRAFIANLGGKYCSVCGLPFPANGLRLHVPTCREPAVRAATTNEHNDELLQERPQKAPRIAAAGAGDAQAAAAAPNAAAAAAAEEPAAERNRPYPTEVDIATHGSIRRSVPPGVMPVWKAYFGGLLLQFTAARSDEDRDWSISRLLEAPRLLTECRGGSAGVRTLCRRLARARVDHDGQVFGLRAAGEGRGPHLARGEALMISREDSLGARFAWHG
jgi:hypothetical protein